MGHTYRSCTNILCNLLRHYICSPNYYQNTSATNLTVSRLTKGVTYYFRVVATNSCPSTANSNTANATTTDPPVSCTNLGNFTLNTSPGANSVNLSWNTPSGTAPSSYSVYYGTTSPANTLSSSTSSNSATISGLQVVLLTTSELLRIIVVVIVHQQDLLQLALGHRHLHRAHCHKYPPLTSVLLGPTNSGYSQCSKRYKPYYLYCSIWSRWQLR